MVFCKTLLQEGLLGGSGLQASSSQEEASSVVFCKTLLQEGLLGGSGLQFLLSPEEASSVVFCKTQLQEGLHGGCGLQLLASGPGAAWSFDRPYEKECSSVCQYLLALRPSETLCT